MKKVGISCSVMPGFSEVFNDYDFFYLGVDYPRRISQNNAMPLVLTMTTNEAVIDAYIDEIDALLLIGGSDIAPFNYQEETLQKCGNVKPMIDAFDFALLKKATAKKIPILGICRGLQLMNCYFGGTLYQDLTYNDKVILKHDQGCLADFPTHYLDIKVKDSHTYKIFNKDKIKVNSFHHQCIKTLAPGFRNIAESSDKVIEIIEKEDYGFMMGVQFHPEMMANRGNEEMDLVFKYFIEQI